MHARKHAMGIVFIAMLQSLTTERDTLSEAEMITYEHQLTMDRYSLIYCKAYFREAMSLIFRKYRDTLEAFQFRCSADELLTKVTASALDDLTIRDKLFSTLRLTGESVDQELAHGLQYVQFRKYFHQKVDRFIGYICITMHRNTLEQWNDRRTAGHGSLRVPVEVMST